MTDSREEMLALADRIEATSVISIMVQPKKPGPVWALPLSDSEQAAIVAALRTTPARCDAVTCEALIERCAKIADPWPGFNVGQKIQDPDYSVIEVRTKIAAAIRALAFPAADRGDDPFAGLPRCTECGAIAGILCDYTKCPGDAS